MLRFFSFLLMSSLPVTATAMVQSDEPLTTETTQSAENAGSQDGKNTDPASTGKVTDQATPDDESETESSPLSEADELIGQLDHERLTMRQQARRKLLSLGKAAIPSLAKAALSGKRESIEKSIEVLGKLAQSKDEETRDAARVTLQMLSESDQPSTADRARLALETREADGIRPFEGWDKPGNPFAGGGQVGRSVSVSSVNGVLSLTVQEGERKTTIQELSGGRILVEVTGGEKPVELTARNAEELKKKLPEVAALYEQYAGGKMPGGPALPGIPGNPFAQGQNVQNAQNAFAIGKQKGGAFGAADAGNASQLLADQLRELRRRMDGNPAMQQLLDEQIRQLAKPNP